MMEVAFCIMDVSKLMQKTSFSCRRLRVLAVTAVIDVVDSCCDAGSSSASTVGSEVDEGASTVGSEVNEGASTVGSEGEGWSGDGVGTAATNGKGLT